MSPPANTSDSSLHGQHPPNSLRNLISFPGIQGLHDENDPDTPHYRWVTPSYIEPARHWCFLAQIVRIDPWPLRLVLRVEDKEGEQCVVTFNDSDRGAAYLHAATPGNTIAIIDPDLHGFMDGQIGIRLEDDHTGEGRVKILPFKLTELLTGNDAIQRRADGKKCEHCGQSEGDLRNCARCQTPYCSKVCIQTLMVAYSS